MFFVVAIIILVASFLIALVSLLREQRKVHSISQRQQQSAQTANLAGDNTSPTPAVSVEMPVTSLEEVTTEPVKDSVPASTETQPAQKRVDEETVPFPWEVKSGNNVVTQPNRETAQTDERPPNISNSVPSPADPEVPPQILPPQNISRASAPSLGLNGSVSLKDLKK